MRSLNPASNGFALVEVMVALLIGGIVLLGARAILVQLAGDAERIVAAAASADHEANAERTLRLLAGRLDGSDETGGALSGNARAMRLRTWCDAPAGWLEPCETTIGFVQAQGGPALAASLSTGVVIVLRSGFGAGELRYLNDARAGGTWLPAWTSRITTPLAVAILIDGDTTIVRIGERG